MNKPRRNRRPSPLSQARVLSYASDAAKASAEATRAAAEAVKAATDAMLQLRSVISDLRGQGFRP